MNDVFIFLCGFSAYVRVRIRLFVATVLLSTHETQVVDTFAFHGKVARLCDPTGLRDSCRWPTSFETSEATVTNQLVDDFDCELPWVQNFRLTRSVCSYLEGAFVCLLAGHRLQNRTSFALKVDLQHLW